MKNRGCGCLEEKLLVVGGFCEKLLEDSPCSASSKMDLLLAESITDSGSTSVLTYKEGESCYCTEAIAAREE